MILVDMNQISVASVMMHLHMSKNTVPEEKNLLTIGTLFLNV